MTTRAQPVKRTDGLIIFLAILGIVVGFANIYKFAKHQQPGNAVFAGAVIFALSFVLATQLAKMRKA